MKFIALTGHRKSGTTLLHKLFDGHPDLNVYPVDISLLYAFYPCWTNKESTDAEIKNRISLVVTKSMSPITGKRISDQVDKFDPEEFMEVLWDMRSSHGLDSPSAIVKSIAGAYSKYAQLDEKKPFLFKETSQVVNLQHFLDDGLDLKMLQIIRDPRDNYAAIKDGVAHYYEKMADNGLESLASVLNRAKLDLEISKREVLTKRPNFQAIKFEDLVSDTESVMRSVVKQLNIDWNETLLEPTINGENFTGNNHLGKKFNGISAENLGRWRERIARAEACLIEGWMADVMQFWGYHADYEKSEHLRSIADFYAWYNCNYFFKDSFSAQVITEAKR